MWDFSWSFSSLLHLSVMSLYLSSTPVKAAVSPHLPVHLLSRTRAVFHDVDKNTSTVDLPVSVSFLNKTVSMVLSFVIIDRDVRFELVLGHRWETWCTQNKGWSPFFHEWILSWIFDSALPIIGGGYSTWHISWFFILWCYTYWFAFIVVITSWMTWSSFHVLSNSCQRTWNTSAAFIFICTYYFTRHVSFQTCHRHSSFCFSLSTGSPLKGLLITWLRHQSLVNNQRCTTSFVVSHYQWWLLCPVLWAVSSISQSFCLPMCPIQIRICFVYYIICCKSLERFNLFSNYDRGPSSYCAEYRWSNILQY